MGSRFWRLWFSLIGLLTIRSRRKKKGRRRRSWNKLDTKKAVKRSKENVM
jgi:hypothetical protein